MMVKVSAYRLKYIYPQIYNFHLEEAIILTKITRTPNSRKRGLLNSSSKKMYQIPLPHDSVPMIRAALNLVGASLKKTPFLLIFCTNLILSSLVSELLPI